jgi:Tfp pilus assembly protein PilV
MVLTAKKNRLVSSVPALESESGMTLLEVVIASAVMMVLALTMATMMTNQSRQQQQIRTKVDHTGMVGNLRTISSSPDAVANSLIVTD